MYLLHSSSFFDVQTVGFELRAEWLEWAPVEGGGSPASARLRDPPGGPSCPPRLRFANETKTLLDDRD